MSRHASISIFGAGGFAREVAAMLPRSAFVGHDFLGFIDDQVPAGTIVGERPVMRLDSLLADHPRSLVALGVGTSTTRRKIAERLDAAGVEMATVVHDSALCGPRTELGEGSILCPNVVLTVDVVLGAHVHVNLGCTIGHDVHIEAFATLAPGVHVSGNVHIESDVQIGTGVSIINGLPDAPLVIGTGSIIAAGACVTKPVPSRTLVAGVPAVPKKSF